MKIINKLTFLFCMLCLLGTVTLSAQTTVAYIDAEAVIQEMPDFKKARIDVEAHAKQLQNALEAKAKKVQDYAVDFQAKFDAKVLSPKVQYQMDSTLKAMQAELQQEQQKAQQNLMKKENDLMKPVYDKFNAALKAAAVEKKWNYVTDKKLFLYMDGGIDATADVKAKLGI